MLRTDMRLKARATCNTLSTWEETAVLIMLCLHLTV